MSVYLNPTALKTGYTLSWKDAWYSTGKQTYSTFVLDVINVKLLLIFIFYKFFSFRKSFLLYSHSNVVLNNNSIVMLLYLYDSSVGFNRLNKIKYRFKYFSWRRLRLISGWFKYQLFDKRENLKRFAKFAKLTKYRFDSYRYENLRMTTVKKEREKIRFLKKKFSKRKKIFKSVRIFKKNRKLKFIYRLFKKLKKKKKKKIITKKL